MWRTQRPKSGGIPTGQAHHHPGAVHARPELAHVPGLRVGERRHGRRGQDVRGQAQAAEPEPEEHHVRHPGPVHVHRLAHGPQRARVGPRDQDVPALRQGVDQEEGLPGAQEPGRLSCAALCNQSRSRRRDSWNTLDPPRAALVSLDRSTAAASAHNTATATSNATVELTSIIIQRHVGKDRFRDQMLHSFDARSMAQEGGDAAPALDMVKLIRVGALTVAVAAGASRPIHGEQGRDHVPRHQRPHPGEGLAVHVLQDAVLGQHVAAAGVQHRAGDRHGAAHGCQLPRLLSRYSYHPALSNEIHHTSSLIQSIRSSSFWFVGSVYSQADSSHQAECAAGFVVLRELLRQEAARFLKMREFSDISTSDEHEECARFLPGEDRKAMARSQPTFHVNSGYADADRAALQSGDCWGRNGGQDSLAAGSQEQRPRIPEKLRHGKITINTSDVELSTKSVAIPETNVVVELYLFDCAGQSIFNQLDFGTVHYKGASMALVVFDVNNKESFKSCSKWYQDVRDASPNHNIPGVLLANKTDLRYNNRDAITTKEAEEFAERNDLKIRADFAHAYLQQQNSGVEAPFAYIADWFHKKYQAATQRA
ncbi:hypothetical protein ON010_g3308 [Phytophthora cinnamomi]|nr:hypothetical protein ON010_g3308 [Phytophthora cinnamomi]